MRDDNFQFKKERKQILPKKKTIKKKKEILSV